MTEKYAWIPWAAMAGAITVFGTFFLIMLRRMREEMNQGKKKEPVKRSMSDRSDD